MLTEKRNKNQQTLTPPTPALGSMDAKSMSVGMWLPIGNTRNHGSVSIHHTVGKILNTCQVHFHRNLSYAKLQLGKGITSSLTTRRKSTYWYPDARIDK